jgi:hypothetical protein
MVRCGVLTQRSKPMMCFGGLIGVVLQRACAILVLPQHGLRATWLDYPASTHGKGYCLIIFFVEELQRRYGTSEPTPWRRTTRPVWSGACQAVKLGSVDKIVPPAEVAATVLTLVER